MRRIAILKGWEARYTFDPIAFLDSLSERKYDGFDLGRLVRRDRLVSPDEMLQGLGQAYAFQRELASEEARLAADPYGRERRVYNHLVDSLRK